MEKEKLGIIKADWSKGAISVEHAKNAMKYKFYDIFQKCIKGELHGVFYLNNLDCWGKKQFCHSELLTEIKGKKGQYKFDKWWFIFDANGKAINDDEKYGEKCKIAKFVEDKSYNKYAPFIFKDIAEKVLKRELKGDFVLRSGEIFSSELLKYDEYAHHHYSFPKYGTNVDEYGLTDVHTDIKYWSDVVGFMPRTKEIETRYLPISFIEAQKMYYQGGNLKEYALRIFTESELRQERV